MSQAAAQDTVRLLEIRGFLQRLPPSSSYHAYGRAADIHFSDTNNTGTAQDEAEAIEALLIRYRQNDSNIDWYFGRVDGSRPGTGWVHIEYEF